MQLTIKLDDFARRPIAMIDWFKGCRAMIDTGALFPIWADTDERLLKVYSQAKLIQKNVSFSGFGGKTQGNLYRINFRLNELTYIDMPIIVKEEPNLNCHMLLSATMFDGMTYEIDTRNKRLNINTNDNQPVRILKLSKDYHNNISVYLAGTYNSVEEYEKAVDSTTILPKSNDIINADLMTTSEIHAKL